MPRRIDGTEMMEPDKGNSYWYTPEGCLDALKNPPSNRELLDIFTKMLEPVKNAVEELRNDVRCAYEAVVHDSDYDGKAIASFLEKQVQKFHEKRGLTFPCRFHSNLSKW